MEIGKILKVWHVQPEPFPLPAQAPVEPSPVKEPVEEPLVPA